MSDAVEVYEATYAEGNLIVAKACEKYRPGYTVQQLMDDKNAGTGDRSCDWAGLAMLLPFAGFKVDGRWVVAHD